MKQVVGKTFTGETITLDNHHYKKCNFHSCTFVYSGSGGFSLSNNTIASDCKFIFTGCAGDTVSAMKAIYSMDEWGRNKIVAMFQIIAPDIKNLH